MSKSLRFMIVLLWLVYIGQIFTFLLYNPSLHSPMLAAGNEMLIQVMNNKFFFWIFVVESALFIYASTMLWFNYLSGRWTFLLWVLLTFINNFFFTIQIYSSIDNFLEDLNFFVMGVMILLLFSIPLTKEFTQQKRFKFVSVIFTFIIFFIIYFGAPILVRSIVSVI